MLDTETDDEVIARKVERAADIALWLLSIGLIDAPESPYETPPRIGKRGDFVVVRHVDGVARYEVHTATKFAARFVDLPIRGGSGVIED